MAAMPMAQWVSGVTVIPGETIKEDVMPACEGSDWKNVVTYTRGDILPGRLMDEQYALEREHLRLRQQEQATLEDLVQTQELMLYKQLFPEVCRTYPGAGGPGVGSKTVCF